jgi:predicted DNA-binding protein (UPF0251 family)
MAKNSLSGVYNDTKDQGSKLQKTFLLPVSEVQCDWDENIRPLNEEHIDNWLNTLDQGDYVPAILVEMREGVPWVIEGFHRHTAVTQHDEDGLIECKEWKGSEGEKLITMRASTSGLPLTFLEDAEVIADIKIAEDLSSEQLGKRLGISRTAVNNKLLIAEAEKGVKKLIREEKVSATTAIEVITKHGQKKALAQLKHLLERANRKGKAKVTAGSGGTKAFSAAKMRAVLELLAKGLDYEDFATNQDKLGDGDVDIELTLPKGEMVELMNIVEDYVEHNE